MTRYIYQETNIVETETTPTEGASSAFNLETWTNGTEVLTMWQGLQGWVVNDDESGLTEELSAHEHEVALKDGFTFDTIQEELLSP